MRGLRAVDTRMDDRDVRRRRRSKSDAGSTLNTVDTVASRSSGRC